MHTFKKFNEVEFKHTFIPVTPKSHHKQVLSFFSHLLSAVVQFNFTLYFLQGITSVQRHLSPLACTWAHIANFVVNIAPVVSECCIGDKLMAVPHMIS